MPMGIWPVWGTLVDFFTPSLTHSSSCRHELRVHSRDQHWAYLWSHPVLGKQPVGGHG